MSYHFDETRQYSARGCLLVLVIMLLAIFSCTTVGTLALDVHCNNRITAWMPLYPEGEIVSQTHNFLRPFGLGTTEVLMIVPDSPTDVQTWYNEERKRTGVSAAGSARYINLYMESVPQGTQLYYIAYCMGF